MKTGKTLTARQRLTTKDTNDTKDMKGYQAAHHALLRSLIIFVSFVVSVTPRPEGATCRCCT